MLGDPVGHSRSPAIHQLALQLAGLRGEYLAIRANRSQMADLLAELRAGQYQGFNVTMPLKELAAASVDRMTSAGWAAGSVNTLRMDGTYLEGHSTDAIAFGEMLDTKGLDETQAVLVLGTGGSAKAALSVLEDRNVYLSSRSKGKVEALAATHPWVTAVPWGSGVADTLVINCTPVGMNGETLPVGVLEVAASLIDLPYGSSPTPAVVHASELGIGYIDGFDFLARQAAASFEWWTGVSVDFSRLATVARNV
ncbi:MAG: hypothetical protein WBM90_09555 [Acidimicrobiia bacterium]